MRAKQSMDDETERSRTSNRARLALPISLSLGLHASLALTLVGVEMRRVVHVAERLSVRLVVVREPSEMRVTPASTGTAATLERVEPPTRPSRRLVALVPNPSATLVVEPGPVAPSPSDLPAAPAPSSEETARERAERMRALFDPARVARGAVLDDDPGPIAPSGPAGLGPLGELVQPLGEAEAEAAHGGYLAERAAERPWLHETPIVLQRHPDGTYTWQSTNFLATIHSDGRVSFSDRGAVQYDLATGTGDFDLNDLIMGGAGADPFAYERERFVEANLELIERLALGAWEADRRRALERLRSRCVEVWGGETPAAERRAELFEVWHELSADEADRAARDAVLDFIRRELPRGSEDGYTDEELEGFNRRLPDEERFAP